MSRRAEPSESSVCSESDDGATLAELQDRLRRLDAERLRLVARIARKAAAAAAEAEATAAAAAAAAGSGTAPISVPSADPTPSASPAPSPAPGPPPADPAPAAGRPSPEPPDAPESMAPSVASARASAAAPSPLSRQHPGGAVPEAAPGASGSQSQGSRRSSAALRLGGRLVDGPPAAPASPSHSAAAPPPFPTTPQAHGAGVGGAPLVAGTAGPGGPGHRSPAQPAPAQSAPAQPAPATPTPVQPTPATPVSLGSTAAGQRAPRPAASPLAALFPPQLLYAAEHGAPLCVRRVTLLAHSGGAWQPAELQLTLAVLTITPAGCPSAQRSVPVPQISDVLCQIFVVPGGGEAQRLLIRADPADVVCELPADGGLLCRAFSGAIAHQLQQSGEMPVNRVRQAPLGTQVLALARLSPPPAAPAPAAASGCGREGADVVSVLQAQLEAERERHRAALIRRHLLLGCSLGTPEP
eukprot:TRINITY_DN4455_c0_g1_i1.p1 TRINITY_DN4455_c0_g1~~TRINITY_DN4455_c0_g1_i1.p1  ORF type:complete len:500 (+),score=107.59 TRINITY_DN4455_c0_g1_i1:96-1502(+)